MVALLSITSEWSQRSGLTTFTYVPQPAAGWSGPRPSSAVIVAVASMLFAFAVGAVGNVVGSAIAGTPTVWDLSVGHALTIVLGNLISLSIGTMLGMLLRSSAGGLVMYFVLVLLVPNLSGLLAASQDWFEDLQPWVDLPYAQSYLFEGMQTGAQWAHVATTVAPLDRAPRDLRAPPGDAVRGEVTRSHTPAPHDRSGPRHSRVAGLAAVGDFGWA